MGKDGGERIYGPGAQCGSGTRRNGSLDNRCSDAAQLSLRVPFRYNCARVIRRIDLFRGLEDMALEMLSYHEVVNGSFGTDTVNNTEGTCIWTMLLALFHPKPCLATNLA